MFFSLSSPPCLGGVVAFAPLGSATKSRVLLKLLNVPLILSFIRARGVVFESRLIMNEGKWRSKEEKENNIENKRG